MVRTQIQLTEAQARTLKRLAAERNVSMAELIRQGIDFYLHTASRVSLDERKRRAAAAAGRFRSGIHDLSANHDKHLAQAYGS